MCEGSLKSRVETNLQDRCLCISLTRRRASVRSMGGTEEQLGEELKLKWNISKTLRYVFAFRMFNRFTSSYCLITVSLLGNYFSLCIKTWFIDQNYFCKLCKLYNVQSVIIANVDLCQLLYFLDEYLLCFLQCSTSQYRETSKK